MSNKFSSLLISYPITFLIVSIIWWYIKGTPEKFFDTTSYLGCYYIVASIIVYIDIKTNEKKQKKTLKRCNEEEVTE